MQTIIAPELQASPALAALIEAANRVISEELGPCGDLVSASWKMGADDRSGRLLLALSAPEAAGCEVSLTIGDLTVAGERLRQKLRQWCGDVLRSVRPAS